MIEILKNVHLFKGSLIIRPHNFVRTWNTKMKGYLNSAVARVGLGGSGRHAPPESFEI